MKVKEELFYAHLEDHVYSGENVWEVTLIDSSDSTKDPRRTVSFRQHELNTFQPNGLSGRQVALF